MNVKVLVPQGCPTLCNTMDFILAYQAPLSMEFSRQEYESGLPVSSPGNLPNPGIKHQSPALQADSLLSDPPGEPSICYQIKLWFWSKMNFCVFYLCFGNWLTDDVFSDLKMKQFPPTPLIVSSSLIWNTVNESSLPPRDLSLVSCSVGLQYAYLFVWTFKDKRKF